MFRPKNQATTSGRMRRTHLLLAVWTVACGWTWSAVAATPIAWHADISTAREASRSSQRPVLAIFSATWSEAGTRVEAQTLTDAGVAALLSGCFEPVLIDVDQHPDLTRRLKVEHIPTAVILDENESLLATFECPESPAAFVAACGRAAQKAARRETAPRQAADAAAEGRPTTGPVLRANVADRSLASARIADATTTTDVGRTDAPASAAVVAAKVRQLSDFADLETRETNSTVLVTNTQASQLTSLADADAPVRAVTPPTPTSTWPAQQTTTPLAATPQQANTATPPASAWPARQTSQPLPTTIEPQPAPRPVATTSQPWLGAPSVAAPQVAAAPQSPAAPVQQPSIPQPSASPPKSVTSDMLAALKNPFGMFSKAKPAAATPPTLAPTFPQPQTAVVSAPPAADTYGSMPLGLEGYCPVTLAQKGVWTEGRPQYGARHRGRTYLFAGPEQQQAFLSDPDRYSPALSGDDPVLAFESGKTAPGQRRYGVTYQSRMYLFSTPETRATFSANPERYTTRVKLAEQPAPAAPGTRRF